MTLNGFFVLAEFALVKVQAGRIEELVRQGNRRALAAREMTARLDKSSWIPLCHLSSPFPNRRMPRLGSRPHEFEGGSAKESS